MRFEKNEFFRGLGLEVRNMPEKKRLTEKEKAAMPDKYVLNPKTKKYVLIHRSKPFQKEHQEKIINPRTNRRIKKFGQTAQRLRDEGDTSL